MAFLGDNSGPAWAVALTWALLVALPATPAARSEDAAGGPAPADSEPSEGEQAARVCATCHSLKAGARHKIGPNLWGIVGSPLGSRKGFQYSAALQAGSGTWSPEALDRFLANPQGYLPGNKMPYPGIRDPATRAKLIAYLSGLSDERPALPPQSPAAAASAPGHDYGGLPEDDGRTQVYYICSACHSIHLVKQQGLSRKRWQETLDWMVEEQGMDPLAPEEQRRILDYLAKHYGEEHKTAER